jgi:hypothetical protein
MDNEAEKGMAFEAKDGIRRTLYAYVILILPFDRIMEGRVRFVLFFL